MASDDSRVQIQSALQLLICRSHFFQTFLSQSKVSGPRILTFEIEVV